MGRLIAILLLALLIWWLLRGLFRSTGEPTAKRDVPAKGENMVACSRCGVNLPQSEAKLESGKYVCADNPKCLQRP